MSDLSDLRRRVRQALQDGKQKAAARRAARDEASRAWEAALEQTVTPLMRDLASVLGGEGIGFRLDTPAGAARLMSERSPDDYIEVRLDDSDDRDAPDVVGRTVRARGRQSVTVLEEPLGPPSEITTDRLLAFLLTAIQPWSR
ncbi:MAG TPA: hypothetical protein VFZ36_03345 [Vicinamibacterales bacterium]